jgi:hypothetical protein
MVLPLAAVAGRAIMAGGSRMAGAAVTRSAASQGLRTGAIGGGQAFKSMEGMFKLMKSISPFIGKIFHKVSKIVGYLAKFSPALKQSTIIITKAFGLFLRPIGDLLNKFLRPMAIVAIKAAQKWYAMFGVGSGGRNTKEGIEDAIKQQKVIIENAKMEGKDTSKLEATLAVLEDRLANLIKQGNDPTSGVAPGVTTLAPETPDMPTDFDPYLNPTGKTNAPEEKESPEKKELEVVRKTMKETVENITKDLEALDGPLVKFWVKLMETWDKIGKVGDDIKAFAADIMPAIVRGFEGAKNWGSEVLQMIKDAAKALLPSWAGGSGEKGSIGKFWDKFTKGDDGDATTPKAVGGEIGTTGMYRLHAGERVIPAGENSRSGSGGTNMSFSNNFNISASINNDMDIRQLASRLADLQETELRRRVSYL